MHVTEELDSGIIPMNHSNKDGKPFAESEEGRPLVKENTHQPNMYPTQSEKRVSQGLAGVRKVARENKELKFTALLHHRTVDLLRESYYSLKRKAAPGADGITWKEYEPGLEDQLIDLHRRVQRGAFRATPSTMGTEIPGIQLHESQATEEAPGAESGRAIQGASPGTNAADTGHQPRPDGP
jgi:RNA-directed DNA polymerase